MESMRVLYRKVEKYCVLKGYTLVTLDCTHQIADAVNNKWNLGDKVSCIHCLAHFEVLEKLVVNETLS